MQYKYNQELPPQKNHRRHNWHNTCLCSATSCISKSLLLRLPMRIVTAWISPMKRDLRYGYRQTLSQATSVILMCMLGGHQTEDRLKLDLERGWCFSSAGHYREATTRYLLYCWTFRTLAAKHLCVWNNSNGFPESLDKGVIREWGQHESCLHSYSVEGRKGREYAFHNYVTHF